MDDRKGIAMKRFVIGLLVLLMNTLELQSTAHQVKLSKVRQQYVQRLESMTRPNSILILEFLRFLNTYEELLSRTVTKQPLVREESPVASRSVVADENLGYDSDDDAQPLSDF